ncbi:MAG TPA: ABC transporter ATP-binding protein [Anaeromyxobacteraceae bacterium]|nr:ABC transporter ATP-binding protein [Anaeromyxobacteraceae bacterium]
MSGKDRVIIELSDLEVERGGVPVLAIPSFRLHEGEFVSLVGPNGCGKSTLLLSMMGLLRRKGGRIFYRGKEVHSSGDALAFRRRIAMVLQEPLLFDATVHENVASGLKMRGLRRKEIGEKVALALERLRLAGMGHRSARKLSGGEARRVSLARALAVEPEVLLLDEPFSNLDPPTRHDIAEDLEKSMRAARVAAIMVTHDQSEALRLSDRIVVMDEGEIVQCGIPAAVMNDPPNVFMARWVGMETILDGIVKERAHGVLRVAVDGGEIEAMGEESPGKEVYCCIRPENVTVERRDKPGPPGRNAFPAKLVDVSAAGTFLRVNLDCGFELVSYLTPESFAGLGLHDKSEVIASFPVAAVHLVRKRAKGARGD